VFQYKGKEVETSVIGRELGVQAILRGHVVQRGQGLSFFVELIDVGSDKVIWSEQYNRSQADLPTVENEIARDVSSKLHVKLSGSDQQKILKTRTSNSEAYRTYLRGRHEWNKFSLDGLTRSITFFEKAIEIDPNYALAYSGLADSYVNLGVDHLPPRAYMPKARAAALRAIELDGSLAEAYSSLGSYKLFFEWDTAGAEKEYLKAISLDPNYSNARHFYSHCLQFSGREADALREMKTAVELEPLSPVNNAELAWAFYLARQYDASVDQALRTLELEPGFAYGHFVLGSTYTAKGNYTEALDILEKAEKLEPEWLELKGQLAFTHAESGNRDKAQSILAEILKSAEGGYINEVVVASVYAALGKNEQAFEWLERGYEARCSWMAWIHLEPNLDQLREDPRFEELVRKVRGR
ncbi:MAG TPA: tetratricopeptide repeat protein, partial [Pyrinomonadaceae bacterium]